VADPDLRPSSKIFTAALLALPSVAAYGNAYAAETYPARPLRIITAGAGGASDFATRLIAQGLAGSLGQQVVVDNRGGSVVVPAQLLAKSPADGYTLLLHGSTLWLTPLLQASVPYDLARDFAPVALTNTSPNILAVHPSLPAKSVKELIALAKARPGELNYSSGAIGGSSFLAPELFKAMAGVKIVRVAYKTDTQELTDLLAGSVHLTFGAMVALVPHIRTGRLRALAVTSARPSTFLPQVPTIAASGLPGYEAVSLLGMWAPAGTSAATVRILNQETARVLRQDEIRRKFASIGVETVGGSPEQFAARVRDETVKWGRIFKDAGIRAE